MAPLTAPINAGPLPKITQGGGVMMPLLKTNEGNAEKSVYCAMSVKEGLSFTSLPTCLHTKA